MRLTLTRNVLSFIAAICGGVANGGRGEFAGVDVAHAVNETRCEEPDAQ